MPNLVIEMEVMHQGAGTFAAPTRVGVVQVPVFGPPVKSKGGVPSINLCDPDTPFHNLWAPLSTVNKEGEFVPNKTGELHIMTMWVPTHQTNSRMRGLPTTARQWLHREMMAKLAFPVLRDAIYENQVFKKGYDPNSEREASYPEKPCEASAKHVEEASSAAPYLSCIERQDAAMWEAFQYELHKLQRGEKTGAKPPPPPRAEGEEGEEEQAQEPEEVIPEVENPRSLGEWRRIWAGTDLDPAKPFTPNYDMLYEMEEQLRRGMPPSMRKKYWLEITLADQVQEDIYRHENLGGSRETLDVAISTHRTLYGALVRSGRPYRNEAMLQLTEDFVGATAWESSGIPHRLEAHMTRILQAQNICIALISWSKEGPEVSRTEDKKVMKEFDLNCNELPGFHMDRDLTGQPKACGVVYSESLFYLAYYMMMAMQVPELNMEANLREGAYVMVTGDVQVYSEQCRQIGLSWPNDSKGRPRTNAIGKRARIVKLDLERKTLCLSDDIEWVPIKGLLGFESWREQDQRSTKASGEGSESVRQMHKRTADVAQNKHDDAEVRAFWLLHTLIGSPRNQAFREYYGVPAPFNNDAYMTKTGPMAGTTTNLAQLYFSDENPIADRKGPFEDVNRVLFFLARFERDLWIHLSALGFHLSTVFYGAFMRLFASFLPSASLFRFWDFLFSETVNPLRTKTKKPPRHCLIDLAFGTLQRCKTQLLATESALEAQHCIIGCLESMYDPSDVIKITTDAEEYLWDEHVGAALGKVGLDHMHVMEYDKQVKAWEQYFVQFRAQNAVMRDLVQETEIDPESGPRGVGKPDGRVTTKNVVNVIIPTLVDLLLTEGVDRGKFGGMLRQSPSKIREFGPECEGSVIDKVWSWASWAQETMMPEDLTQAVAFGVKPPPEFDREPTQLTHLEFSKQVQRGLDVKWNRFIKGIYETFASPQERRMSLNEFFVALICCSKGTVGEKSMALFHLYAHCQSAHEVKHQTPITKNAATVVEKIDGIQQKIETTMFKPPREQDISKTVALHFKILTQDGTMPHELFGEVFVPVLRPFTRANTPGVARVYDFSIWGVSKRLPPGWRNMGNNKSDVLQEYGIRNVIGDLSVRIKWIPSAEATNVGQIVIQLISIKFNPKMVEAPKLLNPKVDICTYDDAGEEVRIKLKGGGAHDNFMEWKPTMWLDPFGNFRHHASQTGAHVVDGWDQRKEAYVWSQKTGEQFSEANVTIRKELAGGSSKRPNTISLEACRIIVQGIMNRSLFCVTNRQASLISDQIFNRACAVPALLDAMIVKGESQEMRYASLKDLKADFDVRRESYVNVTHQLILAHESSVSINGGNLNLFPPMSAMGGNNFTHLNSIKVQDPFPGLKKVLWIRYARAGDGERRNIKIDVSEEGNFRPANVPLDMGFETPAEKVQMSVTKEEFVSCILQSPLLCESLRKFTCVDNSCEKVPSSKPLKLDISIADPHKEEFEDDLMESLTVRQGVLFEVWDGDSTAKDHFLGEAWLPPWSTIGTNPKTFALPLQDYVETASRPDHRKKPPSGKDRIITGHVTVEASWNFPGENPEELGPNPKLEEIKKHKEMLHTGRLKLKIIKAENLFGSRDSDAALAKQSKRGKVKYGDPYVEVHFRNEAIVKTDHLTGFTPLGWRTSYDLRTASNPKAKNTAEPEWGDEKEFQVKTGSFEVKEKKEKLARNRTQNIRDTDDFVKIGDTEELKIHFGPSPDGGSKSDKPGHRHNLEVYLSDTIYQFKNKLQMAARSEALREKDPKRRSLYEAMADDITQKHLVMVFQPSQKMKELSRTKPESNEYMRLFKEEIKHVSSSWQPLDNLRTFNHYSAIYGFGMSDTNPSRLRICEGTDDYKLRNNRFMAFENEQKRWATSLEHTNNEKECFGFAKYIHKQDGDSTEWRQVLAQRAPTAPGDAKRRYKVQFLQTPLSAAASAGRPDGPAFSNSASSTALDDQMQEREADSVVLWPQVPKIDGSQDLQHQELLRKARQLKDQGLNERDIAAALNEELRRQEQEQAQASNEGRSLGEKQVITVADVEHALKQADQEDIVPPSREGTAVSAHGFTSSAAPPVAAQPSADPAPFSRSSVYAQQVA
jgi:hypothetical protein